MEPVEGTFVNDKETTNMIDKMIGDMAGDPARVVVFGELSEELMNNQLGAIVQPVFATMQLLAHFGHLHMIEMHGDVCFCRNRTTLIDWTIKGMVDNLGPDSDLTDPLPTIKSLLEKHGEKVGGGHALEFKVEAK